MRKDIIHPAILLHGRLEPTAFRLWKRLLHGRSYLNPESSLPELLPLTKQSVRSVEWIPDHPPRHVPGHVRILDQTCLPAKVLYLDTVDLDEVYRAIRELKVRGAPAIGIAAAMGLAAFTQSFDGETTPHLLAAIARAADRLAASRPTAVNLFWALDRMKRVAHAHAHLSAPALIERLVAEAEALRNEDAAMCRCIGEHGVALLKDGDTVLTHCNAGALATAEWGTALAPIYAAKAHGKTIRVVADETRPLLQGARLTAWELMQAGIDVTLICDNTAGVLMKEGRIQAVMVGADRIAANGDTANKIGTYSVAVLAHAHRIPFYVLAPTSTFDPRTPDGSGIPIEERAAEEVTHGFGRRTAPEGVRVFSPAFDVTPAHLISAIVCEKGIARPDYSHSLAALQS